MFSCRNKNTIITLAEVSVIRNNFKLMTAIRLKSDQAHNFLPLGAMGPDAETIHLASDNVRGLMAGNRVDESVTVGVKHFIVECDFVRNKLGVTSATTLQLEADGGHDEVMLVKLRSDSERFRDLVDCSALQFSHALTIAPCTARARKKVKSSRINNA
jgi:hypothetical protein